MNTSVRATSALAALLALSSAATAQLTSDAVPRERLVPRREQVRRELEASRYRLGPFRLQPQFRLRDLGYNDNVYGSATRRVSDWTATVGAGVHWTLPFGAKTYFRGDILPEYTWYHQLDDRRSLGGTYSASYAALFERMSFEAVVAKTKGQAIVSSELEATAEQDARDTSLDLEIELTSAISAFGSARTRRLAHDARGASGDTALARLDALDRDDTAIRGGLRYRVTSFFDVSVAGERTRSAFDLRPEVRDNETEALLLGVHYDRPRFYVNLTGGSRKATPSDGSSFPQFSAATGAWFTSYHLSAPVSVETYGHRRIVFGIAEANPYFLETRTGGAVVAEVGQRIALRAFGDTGRNAYDAPAAGGPKRRDDVVTFGGGVSFRVYRGVSGVVSMARSSYDSNLDEFDRSVVRLQTSIVITGDPSP